MDPKYIPEYWGPKEFTTVVDRMDVRTGGSWRFINKDPAGKEYAFSGVYKEVSSPERVVQTFNYEDMPGHEMTETITYEEQEGKTIITDRAVFQSVEDRDGMLKTGMETGSIETMARFAELVKRIQKEQPGAGGSGKEGEMVIVRFFDASVEQVWKAWTEPERMRRWWGPKDFTSPVVKIDFRVGGKYLIDMRSPDGKDYWSTGVYKEIVPMKKIVVTDSFADQNGNVVSASFYEMDPGFPLESEVILTFEEYGDKTKFTIRYPSLHGMNAKDLEGMRQGWNESFDKLAQALRAPEISVES
jgi:uncharacterized protein YndB with AHSA1/START domain